MVGTQRTAGTLTNTAKNDSAEFLTKQFAKVEKNVDSAWVLVSRPTSRAELFKTVTEYDVMSTSSYTADNIRRRRYCCKKKAEFECSYRMYCIYNDTNFAIYEAGQHNHDESGRLIDDQAPVKSNYVDCTVPVEANANPGSIDTDDFGKSDNVEAIPFSSDYVSSRHTTPCQQSSNDAPKDVPDNPLPVTAEANENPASNNIDEMDAMPSSRGSVPSRQTPQPSEGVQHDSPQAALARIMQKLKSVTPKGQITGRRRSNLRRGKRWL
uniref:FLYWCH-type domain-containing protein n=1 Tax=Panagrellus redivivus TaxID=6233 RepID=A0A7E4UUY5_PANRE